jgi:hypothetical protein
MPIRLQGRMKLASRKLFKRTPAIAQLLWRITTSLAEIMERERKYGSQTGLPLTTRFSLWRGGFLSESAVIYGQRDPTQLAEYISDAARFFRTADLNNPFESLLRNKLYFWGIMRNFSDHVAPALGLVRAGRIWQFGTPGTEPVATGLPRVAAKLVLKPCTGSGGAKVLLYERLGNDHTVSGMPVSDGELRRRLADDIYLVCPYIDQASYARRIFPEVANTVRIVTLYDDEQNEAFVATAVHRFGVRASSAVVDNWGQGGISAAVDLATGRLSPGYVFPFKGKLGVHRTHPDTGATIEGAEITNWIQVRDGIAALASRLPFLPYIGWDVVVTDNTYTILEANNRTDVNLLQVHRPLLADPRVRRFYARHGVIRAL